ncbi:MAG: 50S ribosomal protein L1 [Anaerolineales bacterium]|jgi:large subunit ribosomal protein L1|nr:50S ribosomal protein L1 [Anaerolineaceae bacterium]MDP7259742.1 50S ribosomal protein L1 [Anaerolineales bacterium]HJO32639.1 50S ribosomal protein L1 [Anaerolineales bacterium]
MATHGKKYRAARDLIERNQLYPPREAVELAKQSATANFDETVEVHVRLGIDTRKADQQVRSSVQLPHGLGKTVRVLAFVEGEGARLAEQAGADFITDEETITKIQDGWTGFDVAIAVPEMMGTVGRLGRILGPRGLMPNPKAGTVAPAEDLPRLIDEAKAGKIEFRLDKTANVHAPIGKASFSADALCDNLVALVDAVRRARPSAAKGNFFRRITLATTMGPGIRVDPNLVGATE